MPANHPLLPQHQINRAKTLRRQMTIPEIKLWQRLRNRQCADQKFRKQHPFGPYILDFFCHDLQLAIEVDGRSHEGQQSHDRPREAFLMRHGLQVIHITNDQILDGEDGVAQRIADICLARAKQQTTQPAPSPNPSPNPSQREGSQA